MRDLRSKAITARDIGNLLPRIQARDLQEIRSGLKPQLPGLGIVHSGS